jgi:nanoRNase/pAp phosphatase (c-di-AMP/oligoRNAs hydrolase)
MARRSACSGANGKESLQRSDRFLEGLRKASAISFVSHVHPDPDSLGSMLGLAHLVETSLDKPTRLIRDGEISRAENRAMVELLDIDLEPMDEFQPREGEVVVMVDSQPNTGRHNFGCKVPLYAVIDHHDTPGDLTGVPFTDVRQSVGATCSVVTQYLIAQDVPLPTRLATGLLYGIETELAGYPREASDLDDDALLYLYPRADKDLLARIRNARLPQSYFGTLVQALQSSFIYDRLIISWINDLPQPELTAEVADFLMRFEEVDWVLAGGVYEDRMVLSMRSSAPDAKAGDILRKVVNGMGKAGGHDRRAGGTVYLASTAASHVEEVRSELRRKLLKVLRIEECRGQRLVSRKEMLENLQA